MKWQSVLLIIYSLAIIAIELAFGQDEVRHYLTDIDGDVYLYGINTTLGTILLALTAYNFLLCYNISGKRENSEANLRLFFLLQSIIFFYLAADERFMLHERIGYVLRIHDSVPLLVVAVIELGILYNYRAFSLKPSYDKTLLLLSGICFFIMILIDGFGPSKGVLRLSFEDLIKLWGIFLLFRYSYRKYKAFVLTAP